MTPTIELYTALQHAFDHFNAELFDDTLPQCLITLRSSSRSYGYMHSKRFVNISGRQVDELGINPGYFGLLSFEEVMSTLVHEMVHHWQNHFGTPSKSLPHNSEWAGKMESLGLNPTDTGLPGGKRTGRSMSDYIMPDGLFIMACSRLSEKGMHLPWLDSHLSTTPEKIAARHEELAASGVAFVSQDTPIAKASSSGIKLETHSPTVRTAPTRIRHVCPACKVRAWTAPGVTLNCGDCGIGMQEQSSSTQEV